MFSNKRAVNLHVIHGSFEAVEKLTFSEQPLARNHAFERNRRKTAPWRAHFFFPCINSEIHKVNCRIAAREGGLDHAPGIYEFASQILFYACCRTKRKTPIWLFWQTETSRESSCDSRLVFVFIRTRQTIFITAMAEHSIIRILYPRIIRLCTIIIPYIFF